MKIIHSVLFYSVAHSKILGVNKFKYLPLVFKKFKHVNFLRETFVMPKFPMCVCLHFYKVYVLLLYYLELCL